MQVAIHRRVLFFLKPETSEPGLNSGPGDETRLITSTDPSLSRTQDRRNNISDLKYLAVKQGYIHQHCRLSTIQKGCHGVPKEEFSDQRKTSVVLDMNFNLPLGTSHGPSVWRNSDHFPQPLEVAMGCCYELTVQDVTVPFQE